MRDRRNEEHRLVGEEKMKWKERERETGKEEMMNSERHAHTWSNCTLSPPIRCKGPLVQREDVSYQHIIAR